MRVRGREGGPSWEARGGAGLWEKRSKRKGRQAAREREASIKSPGNNSGSQGFSSPPPGCAARDEFGSWEDSFLFFFLSQTDSILVQV